MTSAVEQFRQRQIEALTRSGTGIHGSAKTGSGGTGAVDRYEKGGSAAGQIAGIGKGTVVENPILNLQSVKFAAAHPEKGIAWGRRIPGYAQESPAAPLRLPELLGRRIQITFPALRADHIIERGVAP